MKKMKILHAVEFYHPIHGGSQEVVKRISEGLVRKGHDVTVVTSYAKERGGVKDINGVKIREFDLRGKLVYGIQGDEDAYRRFVLDGDYDLIMNYAAQVWPFDSLLPVLPQIRAKKVLVPVGFSGLFMSKFEDYFQEMPKYLKHFDHLIFLSEHYRDIDYCRERGFTNYSIIPNGCALEEFEPALDPEADRALRERLGIPQDDFVVLHVGSHTGVKGHREAIEIFNRAAIPNSTFVIVGNVFNKKCDQNCRSSAEWSQKKRRLGLQAHQVISTQLSREDTVTLYKSSDAFLFPSNIECSPIVLFEAMAAQTPFLATNVGNSVEIAKKNLGGEIIQTQQMFSATRYENAFADIEDGVRRLRGLYYDPQLREVYGRNGRENWLKSFTWEKITDEYESLYSSLLKQ